MGFLPSNIGFSGENFPIIQFYDICLRENLQDTIEFPIEYGLFRFRFSQENQPNEF